MAHCPRWVGPLLAFALVAIFGWPTLAQSEPPSATVDDVLAKVADLDIPEEAQEELGEVLLEAIEESLFGPDEAIAALEAWAQALEQGQASPKEPDELIEVILELIRKGFTFDEALGFVQERLGAGQTQEEIEEEAERAAQAGDGSNGVDVEDEGNGGPAEPEDEDDEDLEDESEESGQEPDAEEED